MSKYSFILLSGGNGTRMKQGVPKQYLLLAGKPVIMHTLEKIDQIEQIDEVIIVCTEEYAAPIEKMVQQYAVKKKIVFAQAGATRQESVKSGLMYASNENVIVHEAARPFVTENDFRKLIEEPTVNVIYGTSIPFTVLKGHEFVEGLLDRSELINIQLPQKFCKKELILAHKKAEMDDLKFTEDAGMVHYYFPEVLIKVLQGMDYDIKLTTPMDMLIGEIIYKEFFSGRK